MFPNALLVLGAVIGHLTAGALASPVAAAAPEAVPLVTADLEARDAKLGGVDMQFACFLQNGNNWNAVRVGGSCYDWKCERGNERRSVNVAVACVMQYGLNNAYASCSGGIYNWACYV